MRSIARSVHLVVAWLLVAGIVVQIFLAGLGVFRGPASFITHRDFGYLLELLPIILLVAALLGRMDRRFPILAAVIFGLFILQSVFVALRESTPEVAALHPVNGFLIALLSVVQVRDATMAWRAERSAAPAPSPVSAPAD
jgi:hypothetical protein